MPTTLPKPTKEQLERFRKWRESEEAAEHRKRFAEEKRQEQSKKETTPG